ncbi:MAG: cyclic nucleotide-binding domain-containing protein [Spirochaetaceae bacterium]|nr:MAG: cyclic nucleotide-binding domain-containing protein [Spirochaetaceae bacterium]
MKDLFSFLKKVYFFEDLPDQQIKKIQQVCHQIEYQPGQVIFEEGSQADRFYIVAEGAVEVWKDYKLPEKDLLAVHERGHLFGEMALIDELPRSATVLAKQPTRLFYIDRDDFHRIIQNNSEIAISILKSVTDMVRSSNEYFVENLRERARELEKTNQALQEAQEELLLKDRLSTLGKFSSLILHDIRNPLSILRSMAEMIVLNSREPDRVARNAKRIIAEADRLNQIASELLDYSRGEIRLNMSIVNLRDFFGKLLEAVEEKFQARNIDVSTDIQISEPVIMDEQRMFRVFFNLADNARKAMPQGGKFSIKAFKADQTLKVEVSDTGVGMDPSIQKKIYDPFFSSSEEGGTGLGMSIVKSVIEAHNGTLFVSSKLKGGTTFRVTLPLIE